MVRRVWAVGCGLYTELRYCECVVSRANRSANRRDIAKTDSTDSIGRRYWTRVRSTDQLMEHKTKMAKQRIVVMYGGKADEHSISCISAAGVLRALDTDKFEAIEVGITKNGEWIVGGEDPRKWNMSEGLPMVEKTDSSKDVVLDVALGQDGFFAREDDGTLTSLGHVDAVLPVLHGPYGEDGTIQGLFEMMNVPYVGCGVLASAACMDKHYTKVLLAAAGIPVAPGITLDVRDYDAASEFATEADEMLAAVQQAGLQYPLFVKPSRAGSSFGVTKVEHEGDAAELAAAVFEASHHDWRVLVEQGIDAREIECAVLCPKAGEAPQASWPGEIVLDKRAEGDDQFYDFDSKYVNSDASHVEVPASLPEETLNRVRETAKKSVHRSRRRRPESCRHLRDGRRRSDGQRNQHHAGLHPDFHVSQGMGGNRRELHRSDHHADRGRAALISIGWLLALV